MAARLDVAQRRRGEAAVDVTLSRQLLHRLLIDNVLPAWGTRLIDRRGGGFALHHDHLWRWKGPAPKRLVSQARMLWFHARVSRSPFATSAHALMARHAFDFLRGALRDAVNGGYFWEVAHDGSAATCSVKQTYGQAFALYALSEYAATSGDETSGVLARELFDLMQLHLHDAVHGGYIEVLNAAWRPEPGMRSALDADASTKLVNTQLHVLEALTRYHEAVRDERAVAPIEELLHLLTGVAPQAREKVCADRFNVDWSPAIDERGGLLDTAPAISYGHNIERVWLVMLACRAIGRPLKPLDEHFAAIYEYCLKAGFDRQRGGFYDCGPLGAPARQRDKIWWVQAEALPSALAMWLRTGRGAYAACFEQTLQWIVNTQADWSHGDWHATVSPEGDAHGDKAGAWKEPYHHGRALLSCLEMLDNRPETLRY